jgi:hypothetical protein
LNGADRAEFRALRNKIRSGESLDPKDMKRYNELKEKSTYKPSDWQNRLTSEANTTIMGFQQSLDKDKQNTDDLYVAGQMKSSEHAIQEATDKAYDWNEQSFVDEDGHTWVSDGNGKYMAEGVSETKTAADLEKDGATKVSRSEVMHNKEYADRRRQAGQLAGWANKNVANEAAIAAQRTSMVSSHSDVLQTRVSGQDNVLQLQRDENTSKVNELQGKAQANAEFRTEFADEGGTVVSVEAARQAAEARLAGVIAQNEAAKEYAAKADATDSGERYKVKEKNEDTGEIEEKQLTRGEINKRAVKTATNKQISQKTGEVATNVTGAIQTNYEVALKNAQSKYNLDVAGNNPAYVSEITPKYAETQVKARFDSSQQKMFSDDMANSSRPDIMKDMAATLSSPTADPNRMIAGARTLIAKGGYEDFNKFMFDHGAEITTLAKNGKPEVSKILTDYMATLSEPASKAYGKHVAKLRDKKVPEADIPTFAQWMTKPDDTADANGEYSFQGFIRVNGNTALANASEDTVKFYNGLFETNPEAMAKITPQMVMNGSLTAKDNKTLLAFNEMVTNVIDGSPDKVERDKRRVAAIKGMTASGWAHMKESTFSALMAPYMTVPDENGVQHIDKAKFAVALAESEDLRDAVQEAGASLKKAGGTVLSTMQPELREFFEPYMT